MKAPTSPLSRGEFVSLMAVLMSFVALSIDAMLPALTQIGESLGVTDPNDNQLVITSVFLGMTVGLMVYGPFSDSFGRKKAIYLGVGIFLFGTLLSLFATNFDTMLIGRVLQGFGAAACRVVPTALIRDQYQGREMGRILSLIMMFFIMVPVLAPSLGQAILLFAEWRSIFGAILMVGLIGVTWLHFRQPETLPPEKRLKFSMTVIKAGAVETIKNPVARTYTLAAGIIFGAFIGYLSSSQQILQIQYDLGTSFALYFGGLALAIGVASFANSKLVMKFKMENLCLVSLMALSLMAIVFFFYSQSYQGHPPLIAFMGYLALTFFCFGILFGSFSSLALEPLGHIAGVASSVTGASQTLMSVGVGGLIGQSYDGTVQPLLFGFLVCSLLTLAILLYARYSTSPLPVDS